MRNVNSKPQTLAHPELAADGEAVIARLAKRSVDIDLGNLRIGVRYRRLQSLAA